MYEAFLDAREDSSVGVAADRSGAHSDGKYAFCSEGTSVRGQAGCVDEGGVLIERFDLQR